LVAKSFLAFSKGKSSRQDSEALLPFGIIKAATGSNRPSDNDAGKARGRKPYFRSGNDRYRRQEHPLTVDHVTR